MNASSTSVQKFFTRFVRKNLAYALALFFERGVAFLLLPLYTYVLTPSEMGTYAVLMSFIAFASFFCGLGIENGLLKYAAETKDAPAVMGTAFWSMIVSACFFSSILFFVSRPVSDLLLGTRHGTHFIRMAAGILFTDTLIRFFLYRLLGYQKSKLYFITSLLRGCVTLLMNVILLIWLHWSLKGVILSYLVSNLMLLPFLMFFARRGTVFRFNPAVFGTLFRFGYPVMLTSLCITLLNFFDRYLLQIMISPREAGLYSAAYRIGFVMNMIVTAFSMGSVPYMSHVLRDNPDERMVFSKLFNYLFAVCISVFLSLSLFIQDLVRIRVFGYALINERYLTAVPLVPVILLGYVFYGIAVDFSLGLYYKGKTGTLAMVTFLSFLINLAANLICIPRYGSWGAAFATLIAFVSMSVMMFGSSRRVIAVKYDWRKIIPIFCAALIGFCMFRFIFQAAWPVRLIFLLLFVGGVLAATGHDRLFVRTSQIREGKGRS